MFLHVSVILFTGGCLPHTPWADTPRAGTHPGQTPPAQCMLGYTPTPCPVHAGIDPLPSACRDTPPHSLPSACWDRPPAQCMLGYTPTPCPVHAGIDPLPSACRDTPPTPCPVHAGIDPLPSACWDTVNKLLYILANDVTKARISRSEGSHWWLIESRKVHQVG